MTYGQVSQLPQHPSSLVVVVVVVVVVAVVVVFSSQQQWQVALDEEGLGTNELLMSWLWYRQRKRWSL